MPGGTEFLLPGTELPQPWAACCPARTLAPLGFTHATQCLHTDIFIKLKKVLVSCCVGCEAKLHYLGGKKRPPGAVKISQACKIRRAACWWEVGYLLEWKNSSTEIIHFHCMVPPPAIKNNFPFYIFPGICDCIRRALYAPVMKGNPVQWDEVILGITFNEIKSYNWTDFSVTSPRDIGGCCSHVFVGSLDLQVFLV